MSNIPNSISFEALKQLSYNAKPGTTPLKGKDFTIYCEEQILLLEQMLQEMDDVISDNIDPVRWEKFEMAQLKIIKAIRLLRSSIQI